MGAFAIDGSAGDFFGMFSFSHTEDEANAHLLICEGCELLKDIRLDNGTILPKGRKFDAVWWYLDRSAFAFIDWEKQSTGDFEPKEKLECTQARLMTQGWWDQDR